MKVYLFILAFFVSFNTPTFASTTSYNSTKIVNQAIKKYSPLYKKFKGAQIVMKRSTKEIDPGKNKQTHTMKLTMKRKDYFYSQPEIMTLRYSRDGKKKSPDDFKHMEQAPFYPIFDKNSKKNYKIKVVGQKTINGVRCYKLKVTPKKNSMRFFKGYAYLNSKNLDLVHVDGSTAKISLPLKEFSIKVWYDQISQLPIPKKIESLVRIYIPIILPDTRYKSVSNIFNVKVF